MCWKGLGLRRRCRTGHRGGQQLLEIEIFSCQIGGGCPGDAERVESDFPLDVSLTTVAGETLSRGEAVPLTRILPSLSKRKVWMSKLE